MNLHETATVIDSTKIICWQTCPRKFLFNYIFGWKLDIPDIHLFFGECFHLGMEHIMKSGNTQRAALEAFEIFLKKWREYYPPELDDTYELGTKTPENAARTYLEYVGYYATDDFTVLYTEVSGSVPVSVTNPNRQIHFKIDAICQDNKGSYFVLDHKTASYFDRNYAKSFQIHPQTDAYCHVLYYSFSSVGPIMGVVINGISIKDAVKLKKDGSPYAGQENREVFKRVYIYKSLPYMNAWLLDIERELDDIERDINTLLSQSDSQDTLKCFRRRTSNCVTKYGLCPYHEVCPSSNNPLQLLNSPPAIYTVDFWDPRKATKNELDLKARGKDNGTI